SLGTVLAAGGAAPRGRRSAALAGVRGAAALAGAVSGELHGRELPALPARLQSRQPRLPDHYGAGRRAPRESPAYDLGADPPGSGRAARRASRTGHGHVLRRGRRVPPTGSGRGKRVPCAARLAGAVRPLRRDAGAAQERAAAAGGIRVPASTAPRAPASAR